jgi:hypothetical protein
MYLASHQSINVDYHLTKNQITEMIEGSSTCDDTTSTKGRMTFDDIIIIVNLSIKNQLGKLSMKPLA